MIIVFLGPPASGKDTQAEMLQDNYGYTIISGGEALREEVDKGGEHAATIKEYMERGELVPEEISEKVLRNYLKTKNIRDNIAFTGSVRRMNQLEFVDQLCAEIGCKLDAVIYLNIPDEESVKRISGRWYSPSSDRTYHEIYKPPKVPGVDDITGEKLIKRADDKPEVVRERLKVFHQELEAIKQAYMERGIWHEVDGTPSIQEIHEEIVRVLELDKQAQTVESRAEH